MAYVEADPTMQMLMDEMSMNYDSFETLPVEIRLAITMGNVADHLNNESKFSKAQLRAQSKDDNKEETVKNMNIRPSEDQTKATSHKDDPMASLKEISVIK